MASSIVLSSLEQPLNKNDDECETTIRNPSQTATTSTTMATEDNPKPKYNKLNKSAQDYTSSACFQHLVTATHAAILLFVILIIYYCFSDEFVFFTWHPLLLSIGWMFLMTEAILFISKDNIITGTLPKWLRVRLHWIFQVAALVLIGSGCTVAFITKNNLGKSHFQSWHSIFGLAGNLCFIPACLNGILALYHGPLRNYISPRTNKLIHIFNGVLVFGFGGAALILSVYTKWFERRSDGNVLSFLVALGLVVVAVASTLVRPLITAFNHLKNMF